LSPNGGLRLEAAHCPTCGPGSERLVTDLRDHRFGIPGVFRLVACRRCGLRFLNPRPATAQMATVYPEAYYQNPSRTDDASALLGSPFEQEKLHLIRKWGLLEPAGQVLDVGASRGEFLALMDREGWRGIGVETNAQVARWGRDQWDIDLRSGDLETVALPDRAFNLVTLWQSLEHLPNPLSALDRIRRMLRLDGHLVVAVPNFDSLQAHLFGSDWYHLDPPRHLYHFSPKTLELLLRRAGFDPLATHPYGPLHGHDGCYFSTEYKLRRWLRRPAPPPGRSGAGPGGPARSGAPRPLTPAPAWSRRIARSAYNLFERALLACETLMGRSAAIVAIARPSPRP